MSSLIEPALSYNCCCRGWFAISPLHSADSPWIKSKAAGGVIGPVQRARVADLVSHDEKPLSPGQRVSWFLFKLNFVDFLERLRVVERTPIR